VEGRGGSRSRQRSGSSSSSLRLTGGGSFGCTLTRLPSWRSSARSTPRISTSSPSSAAIAVAGAGILRLCAGLLPLLFAMMRELPVCMQADVCMWWRAWVDQVLCKSQSRVPLPMLCCAVLCCSLTCDPRRQYGGHICGVVLPQRLRHMRQPALKDRLQQATGWHGGMQQGGACQWAEQKSRGCTPPAWHARQALGRQP
jgi:hypothetical protein